LPGPRSSGTSRRENDARARLEIRRGILGVDAALDRVAAHAHVHLRQAQRPVGGDRELLLDDVEAGRHLGHRVFDLQARVHLHEEDAAVARAQELDRAAPSYPIEAAARAARAPSSSR
jgi:hypothetical protein